MKKLKYLLLIPCLLIGHFAFAQTSPVTPQWRGLRTQTGHNDPLIFNYTGKVGGPDSIYTKYYIDHFVKSLIPTNGTQLIAPDSIGLGGDLTQPFTAINTGSFKEVKIGDDDNNKAYIDILPSTPEVILRANDGITGQTRVQLGADAATMTYSGTNGTDNFIRVDADGFEMFNDDSTGTKKKVFNITTSTKGLQVLDYTNVGVIDSIHHVITDGRQYAEIQDVDSISKAKADSTIAAHPGISYTASGGVVLAGSNFQLGSGSLAANIALSSGSNSFVINSSSSLFDTGSFFISSTTSGMSNDNGSQNYGVITNSAGTINTLGSYVGYTTVGGTKFTGLRVNQDSITIKDQAHNNGAYNWRATNFTGGEQLMSFRQLDSLKSTWGFVGSVDSTLLARKIGTADMVQHSYTGYTQTIDNPTGQAYTKYINGAGTTLSYGIFGMQSTQENNYSWNFIYDKPNYVGRHQYLDTAFGEFHWALGERYGRLQYTPKGAPNTGVNTLTITNAGSGYTPGTYDLVTANSTRTPATNERYAITVGAGGTVTSCISDAVGAGYQIGDVVTVPTLPGGTGFSTTVVTLATDNWGYFGKQIGVQVDNVTNTVQLGWNGNLTPAANSSLVQIGPRSTIFQQYQLSGPSNGSGLTIGGGNVGSNEAIYLNPYDTGSVFIAGGNGQTQFGSVSAIAANTKYGFFGTQSASGTQGQSARFRTQLIPTANGQVLAQVLVDPPADAAGTGALTATITTAATLLADGTYDNLASTATTGSGSGQTWKVTVSGGNVTVIVPATAATGGIGYANGNTFTVSTVTGAVFTVASLGYTGLIDIGLEVNAFPLLLPNITAPTTTKFGTLYNTGNILKTVTNAAGVERVMIQTDATGTSSQIPVYNSNGYLVPTAPTGSGAPVEATSPTLITPTLGAASATSLAITGTRIGSTTLVAGTSAVSITGVTTSSKAFVTRTVATGTSLTTGITAVCTSGTLTITADVAAGTINTADTSTYNYFVIN